MATVTPTLPTLNVVEVKNMMDVSLGIAFSILICFFVLNIGKSAITLATSHDSPSKGLKNATDSIFWGVTGLIVALLAPIILNTIGLITGVPVSPGQITDRASQAIVGLFECLADPTTKCQ
jgi:uncharacterized membrane protein